MAVHPFLPGLAVEIIVNDAPLPEYDDDTDAGDSPTMVARYVEATSGANFAIKVSLTEEFPFPRGNMRAEISLDGRIVARQVIREFKFFQDHLIEGGSSQIDGYPKIQLFYFAELEIGEGSTELPDMTSIGTIAIGFTYLRNLRRLASPHKIVKRTSKPVRIPEKALKGQVLTHRAGVSEPVVDTRYTWFKGDPASSSPFATFNFRYRSIDALRILGLIPREPTPPPLEERPEDELSPEELLQLVKQFKNRDAAAAKIKKEAVVKRKRVDEAIDSSDDEDVTVVGTGNRKRLHSGDEEVIVLD